MKGGIGEASLNRSADAPGDGPAVPARYRISPDPAPLPERIRELIGARDLFSLLVGREVRVHYKQTALGILWVVLQPLVPAIIFALVFGSFARLPSGGVPYFLFALSGLVIFGLFSAAASRAAMSFIRDGQLVTKVYFPRSILPLAAGTAAIVDFVVGVVALIALIVLSGRPLTIGIVAVPLVALAALTLGLGLGLGVSALSARFRDFALAVPFVLQILLYATPVVYSAELVPAPFRMLYALNPLVAVTESFRWALLGTSAPDAALLATAAASGTLALVVGVLVFSRFSRDLPDVV